MDDRERDDEERTNEAEAPALEDLDVPEDESEHLKGGTYSFKQAWPKKYDGG